MPSSIRILLLAVLTTLTINQTAQAGILLEPYIGYVSGESKQTTTAKYTGTALGARVGYTFLFGFAAGIDYTLSNLTDDSTPSSELSSSNLGLFVAYKLPILFRAYATYVPSPILSSKSSGTTNTLKSGNTLKLGVGYTGLPFVNLNFEYQTGTYSEVESGGATFPFSPNLTTSAFAISISAPFDLL